jgi:inhibitor of cysteine peptidase
MSSWPVRIAAVAVSLAMISLSACTTRNSAPAIKAADLAVTETDTGKTLPMGDHKTATISLPGNPTTGFSWTVTKIGGTALEQVGTVEYVPDPSPPGMVGAGGTAKLKFKAVSLGQSTITMGYARPWETGQEPAKTFTVTLVVDKAP